MNAARGRMLGAMPKAIGAVQKHFDEREAFGRAGLAKIVRKSVCVPDGGDLDAEVARGLEAAVRWLQDWKRGAELEAATWELENEARRLMVRAFDLAARLGALDDVGPERVARVDSRTASHSLAERFEGLAWVRRTCTVLGDGVPPVMKGASARVARVDLWRFVNQATATPPWTIDMRTPGRHRAWLHRGRQTFTGRNVAYMALAIRLGEEDATASSLPHSAIGAFEIERRAFEAIETRARARRRPEHPTG